MTESLYVLAPQFAEIMQQLQVQDPGDDAAFTALAEYLDAVQTSIEAKTQGICQIVRGLEADAAAIDAEVQRLNNLKSSRLHKAERLRDYLHRSLTTAGLQQVETPLFRASIRLNPERVIVDDPSLIPSEFTRTKVTIDPDKTAIKVALQRGEMVSGAHLERGERLEVR